MLRKKILLMLIFIFSQILFSACAAESVTQPKPVLSNMSNIKINWDQVRDDFEDELNDNPDYPHGKYVDFAVYEDKKTIRLIWPLDNKITQLESLDYGKAIIKAFNDAARTQDFSIEPSNDNSYGGLWKKYNIELEVYNEEDIMNPDLYYINQYIPAGANDPIIPQISKDNDEGQKADVDSDEKENQSTAPASNEKESISEEK